MLCPVCKLVPLTGRKATAKTCSDKCRSAAYRERKQQRSDTPQQETRQTPKEAAGAKRRAGQQQHARSSDAAKWEHIVSAAADRIVNAIELHGLQGLQATSQRVTQERVDMREQLVGQAPKEAAGYRLVLPPRRAGDAPKLSPARSRASEVPWYSLAPFEYPDDVRLCDGSWYRVVWVDAQGQRIRLQPGEPVPGLYYFVGPPTKTEPAPVQSAPASAGQPSEPAPTPLPECDTPIHIPAPEAETASQAAAALPPPSAEEETTATAAVMAFAPASTAPPSHSDDTPASYPRPAEIALPDDPFITRIEQDTDVAFELLLTSYPEIPLEHWSPIYAFVMQVPWMIWLLNEERRKQAMASGLPPPDGPVLNLPTKDREVAMRLASTAPSYLIPFCKSLFAFLRQHGTDVLEFAPVPFYPLQHREQQAILQALRDPHQRTYMEYVCRWQDTLLNAEKVPSEPTVKLRSDRKYEIRKLMTDLRAVMFFRQRVSPSSGA